MLFAPAHSRAFSRNCRALVFGLLSLVTTSVFAEGTVEEPKRDSARELAMQSEQVNKVEKTTEAESSNGPVLLVPVVLAVLALVAVSRRRES